MFILFLQLSRIVFKLSVTTSDRLTDVFLYPPSAEAAWAFETKRRYPLSVTVDIAHENATRKQDGYFVSPENAMGIWKILLNTSSKDAAVSVNLTATLGALADGSIKVYRHPNLQALESQAQHLMSGAPFVDKISADPNASNHRKIFIFPLTFNLQFGKARTQGTGFKV